MSEKVWVFGLDTGELDLAPWKIRHGGSDQVGIFDVAGGGLVSIVCLCVLSFVSLCPVWCRWLPFPVCSVSLVLSLCLGVSVG